MVTETKHRRILDLHLLTRTADERSPFGVKYSTRRLVLDSGDRVSCDVTDDDLWRELSAGIPGADPEARERLTPTDGARFMDAIAGHVRFHLLARGIPIILDQRTAERPDNFRILWKPSEHFGWGHGYQFLCERSSRSEADLHHGLLPVAGINGWGFLDDFSERQERADPLRQGPPRVVTVHLLPRTSPGWAYTAPGPKIGPNETKTFVRAFLRRFFERQSAGVRGDLASGLFRDGRFAWRGGF